MRVRQLARYAGFARVCQGLAGGPLMPLSQTLLLRIFPPEKAPAAIGLWAMTTLVAPVVGPILGGYLCNEYSWPWIFYINMPIALACAFLHGSYSSVMKIRCSEIRLIP